VSGGLRRSTRSNPRCRSCRRRFPAKTAEFKERLAAGESLNDLLSEAFALCGGGAAHAEHAPFDVQLIGGMVLHEGRSRK